VDRWFGQPLKEEQLKIIAEYYDRTPERDLPVWARGLCYCASGRPDVKERHHLWDYGLSGDCERLCMLRKERRLPFHFKEQVWEMLEGRKEELCEQQKKRRRRDAGP